jgi:transcription-repair coupling factor (superfamily II helicase)
LQAAVFEYLKQKNEVEIVICKDDKDAFAISNAAVFAGKKSFTLPDFRASFGDDLRPYRNELFELINALRGYCKEDSSKKILISPIRTLLHPLPKPHLFETDTVKFGDMIKLDKFKEKLLRWGYNFVDIVEERGEASFRGDIADIYPINFENAVRISFFDNQVESIRYFSVQSQKSQKEELESVTLSPALFSLDGKSYEKMNEDIEKLSSNSIAFDMESLGFWTLGENGQNYISGKKCIYAYKMESEIEEVSQLYNADLNFLKAIAVIPEPSMYKDLQISALKPFLEFHKEHKVKILARSEALVKQADIELGGNVEFVQSLLIINLISQKEIIISLNRPLQKKRRKHPSILLDELKIGDYVVHENYGIGIFRGLQNTTVLGAKKDFIFIEYQGGDKLLLPVENLNMIDRYIADSGSIAVVDRLGKGSFLKLKEKTRAKLFEIAKEIINIAAKRELIDGFKMDISNAPLEEFQSDAGFTYTSDQKKSIEEILRDLSSGKVMDRLLSGDVGFGKTEVAMNAILCAAKNGFQSLFIVPTTLL